MSRALEYIYVTLSHCHTVNIYFTLSHCHIYMSHIYTYYIIYIYILYIYMCVYIHTVAQSYIYTHGHTVIYRVDQNHIYTIYIRYFWQGNHQIYGHIRCIYTDLVNPSHISYIYTDSHVQCIYTTVANPMYVRPLQLSNQAVANYKQGAQLSACTHAMTLYYYSGNVNT